MAAIFSFFTIIDDSLGKPGRPCMPGMVAKSCKGETRIADIAYAHGFYELGRFAVVYARMFGERPSETLGRTFY